jgi:hypothetical protein
MSLTKDDIIKGLFEDACSVQDEMDARLAFERAEKEARQRPAHFLALAAAMCHGKRFEIAADEGTAHGRIFYIRDHTDDQVYRVEMSQTAALGFRGATAGGDDA